MARPRIREAERSVREGFTATPTDIRRLNSLARRVLAALPELRVSRANRSVIVRRCIEIVHGLVERGELDAADLVEVNPLTSADDGSEI